MKFKDLVESKIKAEGDFHQGMSIAMHVLAEFINRDDPSFDDYSISLDDGEFLIISNDEMYELVYTFDVDVSEHGYFRSGTYEDPPESGSCEYDFTNMVIQINHATGNGIKQIYRGPDFTNFKKLSIGDSNGEKLMYGTFDDEIQELDSDRESDYPEYDPYDDRD